MQRKNSRDYRGHEFEQFGAKLVNKEKDVTLYALFYTFSFPEFDIKNLLENSSPSICFLITNAFE